MLSTWAGRLKEGWRKDEQELVEDGGGEGKEGKVWSRN